MKHNTTRASSSMGGWEPLPSAVWHDIAEHLPQPWTDGQAAHDLRVYASQVRLGRRRKMPGRVALAGRWGWADRAVRRLLKTESAWQDPRFAERTTGVPEAYQTRTKQGTKDEVKPSAAYQGRTTGVPEVSTRADIHRTHTTEHKLSTIWAQLEAIRTEANPKARADALASLEKWTENGPEVDRKWTEGKQVEPATQRTSGPEVDEKRTARERAKLQTTNLQDYTSIWARLESIRTEANPKARPLKLTSGRRRALSARLKEHTAEELLTVWRWWQTSQHDRAVWLRSKCTVDTILRPSNFPGYLDLASMAPTTKTASDADEVWGLIIDAMGRVGSRRLPTPADIPSMSAETITRAIAALGGPGRWSTLCQTHSRELQYRVRPMFVRSWGSHV